MSLNSSPIVVTKLLGSELPEKREYDINFTAEFKTAAEIHIYVSFTIEGDIASGFTVQLEFKEDQDLTQEVLHEAIEYFIGENMASLQQIDRMYLNTIVKNYNTGYQQ